MTEQNQAGIQENFLMVADHPVLDLLNTVPQIDGARVDLLQSDGDVIRWMALAGWPSRQTNRTNPAPSLLKTTRNLRDTIRALVENLKAGKRPDVSSLNGFLKLSRSHLVLQSAKDGRLEVAREWQQHTAEEVLAPVAEAAAEFLATADFELVRRCEDSDCVLWFYDRTRSHHRRWCSMATCGNRNKVAAYRERKQRQG
ncbi:MAG: hypothetical protein JWM43_4113 [Acidobacteriaceae bacterium]|nr:hypothetical protein [Acidobacteriaceae bacterium]